MNDTVPNRVEHEQSCYDASFVILMQDDLKYDRRFKQPWYWCPEFNHRIAQWMSRHVWYCIGTVFFKTRTRLFVREASCGVIVRWFSDSLV